MLACFQLTVKNLRHERLLGGCMGSTECRSFCYLFLLKTQSPEKWSFSVLDLQIFDFEKRWSSAVLKFRNLPRLFRIKVTVRVCLCIGGDTAIS